ncbi:hypothetical protein ABIB40_001637 [Pedobacter sp. UYP30]|uniref:hypothetical protein n=1 Tax=Pedobacter sp. UYP30 TaxID=1756400 RepID=UPI00339476A8
MKKLTILFFCVATLSLASCKKQTVLQPTTTTPNRTIIAYINQADWQKDTTDGRTIFSILNISDVLDGPTFEDDGFLVYISRTDNDTYEQIPNVYGLNSYSYVIDKTNKTLEIDLQRSNSATYPDYPTGKTRVKIVLVRSQQ